MLTPRLRQDSDLASWHLSAALGFEPVAIQLFDKGQCDQMAGLCVQYLPTYKYENLPNDIKIYQSTLKCFAKYQINPHKFAKECLNRTSGQNFAKSGHTIRQVSQLQKGFVYSSCLFMCCCRQCDQIWQNFATCPKAFKIKPNWENFKKILVIFFRVWQNRNLANYLGQILNKKFSHLVTLRVQVLLL